MKKVLLIFSVVAFAACSTQQSAVKIADKNQNQSKVTSYGPGGVIIPGNQPSEDESSISLAPNEAETKVAAENQKDDFSEKANKVISKKPSKATHEKTGEASGKVTLKGIRQVKKLAESYESESVNAAASSDDATQGDDRMLLYILLILLVPFGTTIAMYLYEGNNWTERVTLNLILTLLCGLPGLIHALIVILGNK